MAGDAAAARRRTLGSVVALVALAGTAQAAAAPTRHSLILADPGWGRSALAVGGPWLYLTDARSESLRTFSYFRTELARIPLRGVAIAGRESAVVAVRTSIGPMGAGELTATDAGAAVLIARGAGFAPPVIWCCTPDGLEVDAESDGRAGAPVALAAAQDGARIRMILTSAAGAQLVAEDAVESAPRRTVAPLAGTPLPGGAAIGPGMVAWVDTSTAPATLMVGRPTDTGVDGVTTAPVAGRILHMWVGTGAAIVESGDAGAVRLVRYAVPGLAPTVLWIGRRAPAVAVGGRTVVVAEGLRIRGGSGPPLRPIAAAAGPVAAIATDGGRVAWIEHVTVGGRRRARVVLTALGR